MVDELFGEELSAAKSCAAIDLVMAKGVNIVLSFFSIAIGIFLYIVIPKLSVMYNEEFLDWEVSELFLVKIYHAPPIIWPLFFSSFGFGIFFLGIRASSKTLLRINIAVGLVLLVTVICLVFATSIFVFPFVVHGESALIINLNNLYLSSVATLTVPP